MTWGETESYKLGLQRAIEIIEKNELYCNDMGGCPCPIEMAGEIMVGLIKQEIRGTSID